jgi:hypothetical protein
MSLRRLSVLCLLLLLVLSGCGGSGKLNARGRIVKGGAPFTLPEEEYLRVTFHPIPADGKRATHTYVAVYTNSDGNFKVVGADGKGLPAGKYRVALEHEGKRKKDQFRGAYDADRSPFVYDVTASTGEIVIDLDKPSR